MRWRRQPFRETSISPLLFSLSLVFLFSGKKLISETKLKVFYRKRPKFKIGSQEKPIFIITIPSPLVYSVRLRVRPLWMLYV